MAGVSRQDITDFHDVIRLLEDHPEWRSELRRVLLTDALLALPDQLARLTEQVAALANGQARLTEQVAELAKGQAQLLEAQRHLAMSIQRLIDDVGTIKGKSLEIHYRIYGSPFFGIVLRRPEPLTMGELTDLLDAALDQGTISAAEAMEIRRADAVVRGTRREDGATVYLVVEVSWSIDLEDVERAARRAAFLTKAGLTTLPVVAGEAVRPSAAELAQLLHVWQMTDTAVIAPAA